MTLTVKNWSEFQHYRDRKPAWIKLHRELLDNYEWHRLPDASRALAPMLWLLASESDDGTIQGEVDEIAFRLRTSAEKVVAALNPLISAGFFFVEQDASAPLSEAEQLAISESEKEKQDKTEEETEAEPAKRKRSPKKELANEPRINLPPDFRPTEDDRHHVLDNGGDPDASLPFFADHFTEGKGRNEKRTLAGWHQRFRLWCTRDAQWKSPARGGSGFRSPLDGGDVGAFARAAAILGRNQPVRE